MGQYFILVNATKREYVRPSVLKLWEWLANNEARLVAWLVLKGPQDGTCLCYCDPRFTEAEEKYRSARSEEERREALKVINEVASTPIGQGRFRTCGRWAGDEVYLVGSYDGSGLYRRALEEFRDVTDEVVREFNEFIGVEELKVGGSTFIRPDAVITAGGVLHAPTIGPPQRGGP